MPPRKDKVNVYSASKTTLTSLRGIGVRTVDHIWYCRSKKMRVDAEKIKNINPRAMKVLDFTVPEGYDTDTDSEAIIEI